MADLSVDLTSTSLPEDGSRMHQRLLSRSITGSPRSAYGSGCEVDIGNIDQRGTGRHLCLQPPHSHRPPGYPLQLEQRKGQRLVDLNRNASISLLGMMYSDSALFTLQMRSEIIVRFFIAEYRSLMTKLEQYQDSPTPDGWQLIVEAVSTIAIGTEHFVDYILPALEAFKVPATSASHAMQSFHRALTDDVCDPLVVQLRSNGRFCRLYSGRCYRMHKDAERVVHILNTCPDIALDIWRDLDRVMAVLVNMSAEMLRLREELLGHQRSESPSRLPMFDILRVTVEGLTELDNSNVHALFSSSSHSIFSP